MMVKIRVWGRSQTFRVAEYGNYRFILEKRKRGVLPGRRWRLEIYFKKEIRLRLDLPNLAIAKAKAQEWFDKNYNQGAREAQEEREFAHVAD